MRLKLSNTVNNDNKNIFSDFFVEKGLVLGLSLLSSSLPDENNLWYSGHLATGNVAYVALARTPEAFPEGDPPAWAPVSGGCHWWAQASYHGHLYPSPCPLNQSLCLISPPFSLPFPSLPVMHALRTLDHQFKYYSSFKTKFKFHFLCKIFIARGSNNVIMPYKHIMFYSFHIHYLVRTFQSFRAGKP